MDTDVPDQKSSKIKPLGNMDSQKVKLLAEEEEEEEADSETKSLLPPPRGGMSRKSDKSRRKVQWNDRNGNKLVEVLEFQPSDASDSDDEDADACICTVM